MDTGGEFIREQSRCNSSGLTSLTLKYRVLSEVKAPPQTNTAFKLCHTTTGLEIFPVSLQSFSDG